MDVQFPQYSVRRFAVCFVLSIYRKKVPILRLGKKWLVFDARLLKKTIAYGWASAMQQATVQMGKIAIQALVNTMEYR